MDGLVEQLGVVGAVDGGAGFLEGGVFYEGVALLSVEGVRPVVSKARGGGPE